MSKILAWLFRTFRDPDFDGVDGKNIRMTKEGLIYSTGRLAKRTPDDLDGDQDKWLARVAEHSDGRLVLELESVGTSERSLEPGDRVEVRALLQSQVPD